MASLSVASLSLGAWNVLWLDRADNKAYDSLSKETQTVLGEIDRVHGFEDFESALSGRDFHSIDSRGSHELRASKKFDLIIAARFPVREASSELVGAYVDTMVLPIFEKLGALPLSFRVDHYWISVEASRDVSESVRSKFHWFIADFNGPAFLATFSRIKNHSFAVRKDPSKEKMGSLSEGFFGDSDEFSSAFVAKARGHALDSETTTLASPSPLPAVGNKTLLLGMESTDSGFAHVDLALSPPPAAFVSREISSGMSSVSSLDDGSMLLSMDRLGVTPSPMPRTPFSPTTELAISRLPESATRVTLAKKVLILEDNSTNAKVALRVLSRMVDAIWIEKSEDAWLALTGYAFRAYNPVKRVHELKEPMSFDCALVDFDLTTSLMQGPAFVKKLRDHECAAELPRLPAFTFTSHYDRSDQCLSSEHAAVFSGIVLKPIMAVQVWGVFCEVFKKEIEVSMDPTLRLAGATVGGAGR